MRPIVYLEPDAKRARLRRREPETGARREKGQTSKLRARGWSQTRKRPGLYAESQRLEPEAARREKGEILTPRARGWSQTRKRPDLEVESQTRKRPDFAAKHQDPAPAHARAHTRTRAHVHPQVA